MQLCLTGMQPSIPASQGSSGSNLLSILYCIQYEEDMTFILLQVGPLDLAHPAKPFYTCCHLKSHGIHADTCPSLELGPESGPGSVSSIGAGHFIGAGPGLAPTQTCTGPDAFTSLITHPLILQV